MFSAGAPPTPSERSDFDRPMAAVGSARGAASTAVEPAPSVPVPLGDDYAWIHAGVLPNEAEAHHALEVISAVPMAAAIGWSVRGHQWTTHPRRLRTAVVSPSKTWDIEVMRGVREVDCLAGTVLVRRRHVERLDQSVLADLLALGSRQDDPQSTTEADDERVRRITRAMRDAGFRLLYLGGS